MAMKKLNNQLRKTLGFLMPNEVFFLRIIKLHLPFESMFDFRLFSFTND